jgi:hypothetical protein
LGAYLMALGIFPCCILAIALMLTKIIVAGNSQINNKKAPTSLLRNTPPRDTNGEKQASPPLRPSTAIDPLSHVCFTSFYERDSYKLAMKDNQTRASLMPAGYLLI